MNEKPSAEVAAGVIGSRLVQALEEFLDSTSRRDEHLVKLLTVMAKLAASAQTSPPGGGAHLEAADVSGVVSQPAAVADAAAAPVQSNNTWALAGLAALVIIPVAVLLLLRRRKDNA